MFPYRLLYNSCISNCYATLSDTTSIAAFTWRPLLWWNQVASHAAALRRHPSIIERAPSLIRGANVRHASSEAFSGTSGLFFFRTPRVEAHTNLGITTGHQYEAEDCATLDLGVGGPIPRLLYRVLFVTHVSMLILETELVWRCLTFDRWTILYLLVVSQQHDKAFKGCCLSQQVVAVMSFICDGDTAGDFLLIDSIRRYDETFQRHCLL